MTLLMRHSQSEFNLHYGTTRQDPGIEDPRLTPDGEAQARAAAERLADAGVRRIIASPYWRALHTAEIVAERLGLKVTVEPLVREQAFFVCDIGSPRAVLMERWPSFTFSEFPERWWYEGNETDEELRTRCGDFRRLIAESDGWAELLVISHWAFIRSLTGHGVENAGVVRYDPVNELTQSFPAD